MNAAEVTALVGTGLIGASVAGAWRPEIPKFERQLFRSINDLPDWLFWPVWAPMQLGNLVVGTLVGLAVATVERDWRLAVAVILAVVLKVVSERLLRRWMHPHLEVRQRPATSQPGMQRRGNDVPLSGPSFPSGHVVLVAAVGAVVATGLPAEYVWIPFALALVVAFGRVYVGAHNPLDVTAGLGLGLVVGALLPFQLG
jgi:glycosyltransferase 2 family protein